MDRVAEIIEHEKLADENEREHVDSHRWEAARLIAEELSEGKSQRQLASEIGKSRNHVVIMATVAGGHLGVHSSERPSFNEAYQAAKRRKPQSEPETDEDAELPEDAEACPMNTREETLAQLRQLLTNYVKAVPKEDRAEFIKLFREMADTMERKRK